MTASIRKASTIDADAACTILSLRKRHGAITLASNVSEKPSLTGIPHRWLLHWVLFITMVFTVPVIFFLFQIVLVVPLAAIIVMSLRSEMGSLIFGAVHTMFFAPLLWGASLLIVRGLMCVPRTKFQITLYVTILAGLLVVAWHGPYSVGGHSNYRTYTWLQAFYPDGPR